jgi:hypothetical protein
VPVGKRGVALLCVFAYCCLLLPPMLLLWPPTAAAIAAAGDLLPPILALSLLLSSLPALLPCRPAGLHSGSARCL